MGKYDKQSTFFSLSLYLRLLPYALNANTRNRAAAKRKREDEVEAVEEKKKKKGRHGKSFP